MFLIPIQFLFQFLEKEEFTLISVVELEVKSCLNSGWGLAMQKVESLTKFQGSIGKIYWKFMGGQKKKSDINTDGTFYLKSPLRLCWFKYIVTVYEQTWFL